MPGPDHIRIYSKFEYKNERLGWRERRIRVSWFHGFISQPIFDGFCFNLGHFEALCGGENSLSSYSNSRTQELTNSYSNFEYIRIWNGHI